jgi:glycosyltransferase involved in cell wall biosynthesis
LGRIAVLAATIDACENRPLNSSPQRIGRRTRAGCSKSNSRGAPSMKISLFIPTLNGLPLLSEVLDEVDRQAGAMEIEKVAVDSGSTDGTVECLRQHGFAVQSIAQREFNHGATRDAGIGRTHGDLVVLLTQDATPANHEWLERLVEPFRDQRVAAAYSRQVPRSDCNPFVAHRLAAWTASRPEPLIQELVDGEQLANLEPMERLFRCAYDNVAGCIRRNIWEQHKFGSCRSGEDVVFGKQVIEAGHRIVYQSRSVVIHSHTRSPRREGKRAYCDHQILREHFGIHQISSFKHFRASVMEARRDYSKQVEAMALPTIEKAALGKWARGYAFWVALGTYLGGNSDRLRRGNTGVLFRAVDRWMHAGI